MRQVKITWKRVFEDFKRQYPNLRKLAHTYRPHSFATIEVWLDDGRRFLYNYDTKRTAPLDK